MTPNILPTIFTATGNYTPAVIKMTEATEGLGLAAKGASKSMAMLSVSQQGVGLTGFGLMKGTMGLLALATGFAAAGREAMNFEKEMGNVGTLVDTNIENMDAMGASVLRLGKIIPKPLHEMTEALYQVRSDGIAAGNGINQAFGVLENSGKLATVGLSTVKEAAESVTSAMNVFAKEGLSSTQVANSFFKAVQAGKTTMADINSAFGRNAAIVAEAGVTLEEYNALTATLTMTGMKAANAQNGISQAVTALIKPSTDLDNVYQSLGYSGPTAFKDIVKQSGGLVAAMSRIDQQGTKMGISFGEDFREKRAMMVDLLATGTLHGSFLEKMKSQMDGVDAVSGKFAEQMTKSAQQFEIFKNGITTLGIKIGNTLLPALNSLFGILEPVMDTIGKFSDNHKFLSKLVLWGGALWGLNKALGISNILLKGDIMLQGLYYTATELSGIATLALAGGFGKANLGIAAMQAGLRGLGGALSMVLTRANLTLAGLMAIYNYRDEIASWANDSGAGLVYNNAIGDTDAVRESLMRMYKKDPNETKLFIKQHPGFKLPGIDSTFNEIDRSSKLDSINKAQQRVSEDAQLKDAGFGYQAPYVAPSSTGKGKTDELLSKIYEVLKNNPQASMQPAMAQNGQSARRAPVNIYSTFR